MGLRRTDSVANLVNAMHDDPLHTLRTGIKYEPVLNDAANSGGTTAGIVTGTSGTVHGTATPFTVPSPYAYDLLSLTRTVTQSGTFGTITPTGLFVDGKPLGTAGNIANFATLYGKSLQAVTNVQVGYRIDTGTGVVGTYAVQVELVGVKFDTVQGVMPA